MLDILQKLESLHARVEPLERFIQLLSFSLPPPSLRRFGDIARGYRYGDPNVRHFCLLKAIRAVSAFNATITLCRAGFTQEIVVLLRTVVECTSHIDFVLANDPISDDAQKFVDDYFSDSNRGGSLTFKKSHLRQGAIHNSIGQALEKAVSATEDSDKYREVSASKLYSNVYLVLSNYVHCRYPETMDLYGGTPGHFHLRGMAGTPKDAENLEMLETFFVSISQCLHLMALRLKISEQAKKDPILSEWMRSNISSPPT